ncbi:hypothetical protein N2152v2_007933 [Parachlorella kessleri]
MATVVLQRTAEPQDAAYFQHLVYRPWFALYNVRLRPRGAAAQTEVELALIQKLLPEELLLTIFGRLPITALGAAQNCWKTMFLDRPHLRFDGCYVSRNTYLRTGVVEWKTKNPVHLVCYFRYYRFFPDGTFLYRTTPEFVSKVARSLMSVPRAHKQQQEHVYQGRFKLEGSRLLTAMRYDSRTTTEIRSRLGLRSTVRGANNRLDVESIVSYDLADGMVLPMSEPDGEVEEMEGAQQRSHRRGLAPFVFVPWDQVQSSPLNLPVTQMDYFVPG